jgi:hypothetical protein
MGAAMSDDPRRQKPVTIEWAYDIADLETEIAAVAEHGRTR